MGLQIRRTEHENTVNKEGRYSLSREDPEGGKKDEIRMKSNNQDERGQRSSVG